MTRWSLRQRNLLNEMGVRVWWPDRGAALTGQIGAATPGDPDDPVRAEAPAVAPVTGGVALLRSPPDRAQLVAPSAVADMDWAALRAAVAACTACPLCAQRKNTVFGTGNPRARCMIVGEAPGEQEDLRGEPFVGKSGQLLDSMLAALRLSRADGVGPQRQVYIANTVKCRPPANRNPEPTELAKCEPFLVRQIELVEPKVIVAMGRFAVQSLLRSSEPIGRLRGRVHRYGAVPLVVTYHPAYLLRNLQDKARAWEDLCLAREVAAGAGPAP